MSEPTLSAVLVSVPAADRVVGAYRQRFDRSAWGGVPAHVTVLYPFVPPSEIDDDVLHALAQAVVVVPRFHAEWKTTRWFGSQVLWLAPEPEQPFAELTSSVLRAFPGYVPYQGKYDPVPHLTVGDQGSREELLAAEREILPELPVSMDVSAVQVKCGTYAPGSWHTVAELPLG